MRNTSFNRSRIRKNAVVFDTERTAGEKGLDDIDKIGRGDIKRNKFIEEKIMQDSVEGSLKIQKKTANKKAPLKIVENKFGNSKKLEGSKKLGTQIESRK